MQRTTASLSNPCPRIRCPVPCNLSRSLRGLCARCWSVACSRARCRSARAADDDISASARLLMAARAADAPAMERALAGGAAINSRNRLGESALMVVLKNNHPELAPALIAAGADVNLAAINGLTPLMAAAYIGATDVVRALLRGGADVNAVDRLRKNAMTYAAGEGHVGVVRLLLDAGVERRRGLPERPDRADVGGRATAGPRSCACCSTPARGSTGATIAARPRSTSHASSARTRRSRCSRRPRRAPPRRAEAARTTTRPLASARRSSSRRRAPASSACVSASLPDRAGAVLRRNRRARGHAILRIVPSCASAWRNAAATCSTIAATSTRLVARWIALIRSLIAGSLQPHAGSRTPNQRTG